MVCSAIDINIPNIIYQMPNMLGVKDAVWLLINCRTHCQLLLKPSHLCVCVDKIGSGF